MLAPRTVFMFEIIRRAALRRGVPGYFHLTSEPGFLSPSPLPAAPDPGGQEDGSGGWVGGGAKLVKSCVCERLIGLETDF